MSTVSALLEAYGESLQQLVAGLDEGASAEHLLRLNSSSSELFLRVQDALATSSSHERAKLAPQIAQARVWSRLAGASAQDQRTQAAGLLVDVQRARSALAQVEGSAVGESCDIAG